MAAYNWIVFNHKCPRCNKMTTIKAQCHVAASFSGDERGRFCDRTYYLGEKMRWWREDDIKSNTWMEGGEPDGKNTDTVQECCYTECSNCQAELYAIIQFQQIKPTSIVEVGLEKNWPVNFKK